MFALFASDLSYRAIRARCLGCGRALLLPATDFSCDGVILEGYWKVFASLLHIIAAIKATYALQKFIV
jgi:hypothetical protein